MRSGRKKQIRFCGKDLERSMLHAQSGTGERIKRGSAEIFSVCIRRTERIFVPAQEHLTNFFSGKNEACPGAESSRKSQPGMKGFSMKDSIDGEKNSAAPCHGRGKKFRLHIHHVEKFLCCVTLSTMKEIASFHHRGNFFYCIFTRAKRKSEHQKTLFGKYQMVPLRKIKVIRTKKEMVPFKNKK